ncbi:hypothetical protein Scep_010087 [Stephania cephalantha]|uniref:Uncharacterized protein n=1 Tax=Stephania cephalantha TaxID=152367 RepID=A0AAP0JUC7_9MAGN
MEFVVTDLITDILVRYQGPPPDLFREGHSVVVEGFVRPPEDPDKEVAAPWTEKAGGSAASSPPSRSRLSMTRSICRRRSPRPSTPIRKRSPPSPPLAAEAQDEERERNQRS